jgi:uncharacterized membrane protein
MDLVLAGAHWLHLVATVALIGYYAALALLVLPAFQRSLPEHELGEAIAAVERRALPVLVGSVAVFIATGVYLMGADDRYGGVGNVSDSWASLLLVKHLVVVGMIGLGLWVDSLIVRGVAAPDATDRPAAVRRLVRATQATTLAGAVVLLLTAAAQAV